MCVVVWGDFVEKIEYEWTVQENTERNWIAYMWWQRVCGVWLCGVFLFLTVCEQNIKEHTAIEKWSEEEIRLIKGWQIDRQTDTDRQTHRPTDRHIDRQTDTQTDSYRYRQTNKQTRRETNRYTEKQKNKIDRQTDRQIYRNNLKFTIYLQVSTYVPSEDKVLGSLSLRNLDLLPLSLPENN